MIRRRFAVIQGCHQDAWSLTVHYARRAFGVYALSFTLAFVTSNIAFSKSRPRQKASRVHVVLQSEEDKVEGFFDFLPPDRFHYVLDAGDAAIEWIRIGRKTYKKQEDDRWAEEDVYAPSSKLFNDPDSKRWAVTHIGRYAERKLLRYELVNDTKTAVYQLLRRKIALDSPDPDIPIEFRKSVRQLWKGKTALLVVTEWVGIRDNRRRKLEISAPEFDGKLTIWFNYNFHIRITPNGFFEDERQD